MSGIDLFVILLIAVLFVLAVRYLLRHGDSCAGCGGSCSGKCSSCRMREAELENVPERFRLKSREF